jgi:2-methylisocitrate lyase-like PEP mutase family enzyme
MISSPFHNLHVKGDPLILYNIWDVGSAKAIEAAGAQALATGSWSVAAASGYKDGEIISLDQVIRNINRIITSTELPVSLDFEGGYTNSNVQLDSNVKKLMATNVAGINFEDQIVGSNDIYSLNVQSERINTIRKQADIMSKPLFINARTDLFLQEKNSGLHTQLINKAIDRSKAYHLAGADGFFAPGLKDADLIQKLCAASPIPVNIMMGSDTPNIQKLKNLGVARISYGPTPYLDLMATLKEKAKSVFSQI